jgi:GNAT superfamily N-acetyltransferase
MPDLLVRLYELPDIAPAYAALARIGVRVRRPEPWERAPAGRFVREHFTPGWAAEFDSAFAVRPASTFIASERDQVVGFACYDCTRRNFFGPTGVAQAARGRGIGHALLLACLHAMRDAGYAYAIIGGAGPVEFYARTVGATEIAGSVPGIYDFGLLRAARAGGTAKAPPQVDASRCPVCGCDNRCVMAAGEEGPCWCALVSIDPAALARVPEPMRGVACLCPVCAKSTAHSGGGAAGERRNAPGAGTR